MSTCISQHGEYSHHEFREPDEENPGYCRLCGAPKDLDIVWTEGFEAGEKYGSTRIYTALPLNPYEVG